MGFCKIKYMLLLFPIAPILVGGIAGISCEKYRPGGSVRAVLVKASGYTVGERFLPPEGYERMAAKPGTFAAYLRNFPLLPSGSPVLLHDGSQKWRQDAHAAVLDLDTGKEDLQQCADAVMRLRAEHLFSEKKYEDIHFNFTNGFRADYARWRKGDRIAVKGNKTWWKTGGIASGSYESFRKYLNLVFMYAGTLSLSKELKPVEAENLQAGDVFIKGGSPGHAVVVMDVALEKASGKRVFLLAQSYMPAQQVHILKNPEDGELSPWYSTDFGDKLRTPEWEFSRGELGRF